MADDQILYTYHPQEDRFIVGVPQRDLDADDVRFAGPTNIRIGVDSGLYQPVAVIDTRTPAEKAADTRRAKAEAEAAAESERIAAAEQAAIEAHTAELANAPADVAGDDDSGDAGEGNDGE